MGYRSDVRSVIYGPPDKMAAFVFAMRLDNQHKKVFEYFADNLKIYTLSNGQTSVLDLECSDVKWYDGHGDVQAWHALMLTVDTEAEWADLEYEFVRVGEEDGDIQKESSRDPDWLLYVSRPAVDLDVDMHLTTEGFPNETDNVTAGQEQAASSTGVLCDADHVDADHRVGGSADGGDGHGQDPLQPDVDG